MPLRRRRTGPVKVSYRIAGNQLIAVIDRPAALPGTFTWRGKSHPLTEITHEVRTAALKEFP